MNLVELSFYLHFIIGILLLMVVFSMTTRNSLSFVVLKIFPFCIAISELVIFIQWLRLYE